MSKRAARFAGLVSLVFLCSPAANAAVPKILINSATPNAGVWGPGWHIRVDNLRQWVSGECRARLEGVGVQRTILPYSSISNYSLASSGLACGSLVWQAQQELSSGGSTVVVGPISTPTVGYRMLVNTQDTRGQGWVLHTNSNRIQYVNRTCRSELEGAGIDVTRTDWSAISQFPKDAYATCATMVAALGGAGSSSSSGSSTSSTSSSSGSSTSSTSSSSGSSTSSTSSGSGSSGSGSGGDNKLTLMTYGQITNGSAWVRRNGQRQWVNATCAQSLRSAGVSVWNTVWSNIKPLPQNDDLSCDTLVSIEKSSATISGGFSDVGATGSSFRTNQCMGMNDDFLGSWDGGHTAADAFKGSRGPFYHDYKTPTPVDANNWPVGSQLTVFILGESSESRHTMEKANPWVLIPYHQSGSWRSGPSNQTWDIPGATYRGEYSYRGVKGFEFSLGRHGNTLKIYPGNLPPTPRNRWHLVPKNMANDYMAAMLDNNYKYIFDTDKYAKNKSFPLLHTGFKNHMKDFCRIRYMIGSDVNTLNFSGRERDRNKPSYPSFDLEGGDGRPYEWKVWMANHLGLDVWHTDHVKTWEALQDGDSYLENQAKYYRDNLEGNLVREYGNEIWNSSSPFGGQTNYVRDEAPYRGNLNWGYGKRTYDTAGVWEDVWASRRDDLDLTIGAHTPSYRTTPERLIGPAGESWYKRADSLALTFYIGNQIRPFDSEFLKIESGGVNAVSTHHKNSLDAWKGQIDSMARTTLTTLPLVNRFHLYEGASHLVMQGYEPSNWRHLKVGESTTQYLNSSTFHNHMTELFSFWAAKGYAGEAMWFNLYGINTPQKPFAMYRSTFDTVPSYSGAGSYIKSHIERYNQ